MRRANSCCLISKPRNSRRRRPTAFQSTATAPTLDFFLDKSIGMTIKYLYDDTTGTDYRGPYGLFTFGKSGKQELQVIEEVHGAHTAFQEECHYGATEPTARTLSVGRTVRRSS